MHQSSERYEFVIVWNNWSEILNVSLAFILRIYGLWKGKMMESNLRSITSTEMDWRGKKVMKFSLFSSHNMIRKDLN